MSERFDNEIEADISRQRSVAQGLDDLQNEIAGRDTGRRTRFLTADGGSSSSHTDNASAKDRQMSALQFYLLNDPIYAAMHRDTMNMLARAEAATEAALITKEQELSGAKQALQETLDQANTLADGTRVFRAADGTIMSEHGDKVSSEEAKSIVWKDNAPSYEDYLAGKAAVERADQSIQDLRTYQVDVLGNARDELNDPDNPPSAERMDEIQRDIEAKAPHEIRASVAPDEPIVGATNAAAADIQVLKL